MKRGTPIQKGQEHWRLKLQKIECLQRLELYDQWCLQLHHCYCRFHGEHPLVPVRTAAETMEVVAGWLEKVLEEAFENVAQQESPDLPITNTIKSWLIEQEDVVRTPESIASWSETASHISCAHHCLCRKEIAHLQSENQAITINQEKPFCFFNNGKNFCSPPPYPPKDPPARSASSTVDAATEVFSLAPTTDSRVKDKKIIRTKLKERVFESKSPERVWETRKKDKKKILTEKIYTDPMIAAQVLLAHSLLIAAGASGAGQVSKILAGGCGIEDIINPLGAKLRAIAKQPKYNGNPGRWAVLERVFSVGW